MTATAIANRQDISEEEWLDLRKNGVGGSDAAAALGIHPYKTSHDLYLEKRGELDPEDLSDNEAVHFGQVLEDTVAEEFSRRSGKDVHRVNRVLRSQDHPFMLGNLDRKVEHEDAILECKTAGTYSAQNGDWGEEGTDQVPTHYLVQCMHYLIVAGYERAYLAVLIGGREFRTYEIGFDGELATLIIENEASFWQRVEEGRAPTPDYDHPDALELMKRKYPGTSGEEVDLPDRAADLRDRYKELGTQIKDLKSERKAAKAELLDMVGEAAVGHIPGGGKVSRSRIDEKEVSYTRSAYMRTSIS